MAPPVFFLLFVAAVILIGAAIAFFGIRAGLWVKETDPNDTLESDDAEARDERFGRRPEHNAVDDAGKQTYIGT
jgi:hypothetical protein